MAFISALWGGTQEKRQFDRANDRLVVVNIGYDDAGPISYDLMVELCDSDFGGEFMFSILHIFDGEPEAIFDSAIAGQIIPKSYRAKILDLLLNVTEDLVRARNLDSFAMVTFCDNLPSAALEKYDRLCEVFTRCGYTCEHTEPETGKHHWQMNRGT